MLHKLKVILVILTAIAMFCTFLVFLIQHSNKKETEKRAALIKALSNGPVTLAVSDSTSEFIFVTRKDNVYKLSLSDLRDLAPQVKITATFRGVEERE